MSFSSFFLVNRNKLTETCGLYLLFLLKDINNKVHIPKMSFYWFLFILEDGMRSGYAILAFVFLHSQLPGNQQINEHQSNFSYYFFLSLVLVISYFHGVTNLHVDGERNTHFDVQDDPTRSLFDWHPDSAKWVLLCDTDMYAMNLPSVCQSRFFFSKWTLSFPGVYMRNGWWTEMGVCF